MTATTILEVFEPPDGRVGHSAVFVAMTGAEDFLEAALVSFTGLKARQRAELGVTLAYLVLDPHATPSRTGVFPPSALPGLHELQPRPVDPKSLLHAKLVLLAFAPTRTGEPTDLRLAILSANFTYTCARHQLELAWLVDVPVDRSAPARDRADIAAAASFVRQLIERRYYLDERALPPKLRSLTRRLDILLDACAEGMPQKTLPGFIHSLDEPLHPQIRSRMRRLLTRGPRNLLLCGSGFYETPTKGAGKPTVLSKLEDLGVLTDNVRRIAIAEPTMAGAIAPWVRGNAVEGWEVVAAHDSRGKGRTLHAKFIYAGYWRDGAASNGCLYLGSGNLSRRGLFTSGAQTADRRLPPSGYDGMNIECGVVFSVPERLTSDELAQRLFWLEEQDELDPDGWEPGPSPELDDLTLIVAAPILSAELSGTRELRFRWRDDVPADGRFSIRVGAVDWLVVTAQQASITLAEHEEAMALHVRNDETGQVWSVPIVDPAGRVCWSPPTFSTYDEALAALLDFPIRPAEATGDDEDGDSNDNGDDAGPANETPKEDHAKSYALHAAAKLIEDTSALQRALPKELFDDWLDHIERFFCAAFPLQLIAAWKEHRIDVFVHLAKSDLRPPAMSAKQRKRYDAILARVASNWGLR